MPKTGPFETFVDAYDAWFDKNPDLYAAELDLVRRLLPPSHAAGLEVGVGSGQFAGPLGVRMGLEPAEKMAQKASKRGIQVVRGVAENLPFADGRFDVVLMVTAICFMDDVALAFTEARRILKPGGRLVAAFIDSKSELGRQYQAKKYQSRYYRDAAFFSSNAVLGFFKASGFAVNQVFQTLVPGTARTDARTDVTEGWGKGAFVGISGLK